MKKLVVSKFIHQHNLRPKIKQPKTRFAVNVACGLLFVVVASLILLYPANDNQQAEALSTTTGVELTGPCPDGQYKDQMGQCHDIQDHNTGQNVGPPSSTTTGVELTGPCPDGQYKDQMGQCHDIQDCGEGKRFDTTAGQCVSSNSTSTNTPITNIIASYVPGFKITLTVPSSQLDATSRGTEAWTKTWNQITALDYPEFTGGAPTFCDSNDLLSMGLNATNGKAPNDLPGLFPVWCGNSKYVWQCTSDDSFKIITSGGGAMSLQIQCYPPESQDDIDNGHVTHADGTSGAVVTKEVYKQWQEERGISYEDSVGTSGGSQSIEDQCETSLSGFGWLICPAVGLLSDFTDQFYGWIDATLQWTLLTNPDINSGVRNTWQQFLNIANILFAIAFLIMIYSMATSTGLSNYDVKKMLPRLIVVAIAVNTSFYLCAALVDISNIVGSGIRGLVGSIGSATYVSPGSSPWDAVAGTAAVIAIAISAILFLGSGIAALIIIFASIIFRQMALVLIIVISPLAIVCYMLPNTQKWFQQWWNMFVKLLLVYPMFGLVWGASQGLAGLLAATVDPDLIPPFIFSLVALIIPAVSIIPLFKMSGGLMAMATGAVAGSALARNAKSRINTGVQNRGKRAYHNSMLGRGIDRHRERVKDLDKQVNEGSYAGYNPLRRARQAFNRGVNKIPVIGGAKGVSSDKDLGNFLKNYTYVDKDGNVQHLTDDQMLDYIQGRAAKDADGRTILAAQNLNAEQIGSGIKALGGDALEDVYGKTTTSGAPVAATDASKRYAHLQATSNMHEIYAKHGIDIGKDVDNAYEQMYEIGVNGSYTDKNGTVHTVSSAAQNDVATMMSHFDANAGSADAEKIFNEEAKTFQTKRQSSAIKTTISGFTDAAAKRESDEISQALGSAMKAREFKKNAFKSGASTPPSS